MDTVMKMWNRRYHDKSKKHSLINQVCEKVSNGRVLSLIESFLTSGIMNEGIFEASTEGTPQGGNLSPEKTKIVHARKKGMEYLGFHSNGRWRRPKDKAVK